MKVNFNAKLVKLIEEVHHLQLLGYTVPSRITDVSDKAKFFLQRAKALEQVWYRMRYEMMDGEEIFQLGILISRLRIFIIPSVTV